MKKAITLILVAAMALSISGCQDTPEASIVAGKSSDELIEKAQADAGEGTLAEKLGSPETYQSSVSSADGKLNVTIDATVTVPEAEKVPVYRVEDGSITQAQADALREGLVRTTLYDPDQPKTKDEIEAELLEAKQKLAEGPTEQEEGTIYIDAGGDSGESSQMTWEQHMQDTIDRLTEEYAAAPETVEPQPITGQFVSQDEKSESISGKGYEEGVGYENFSVSNDRWQTGSSHAQYFRSGSEAHAYLSLVSREKFASDYPDFDLSTLPELTITEQEAAELGDELVDTLDIPGMSLYSINKMYDEASLLFPEMVEDVRCLWVLQYTRVVDGVPITYSGDLVSVIMTDDGTFKFPWAYEKLTVYVGDDGIVEMYWDAPYELTETVTEDSALLRFDDIMDIFEKMYVVSNDGQERDVTVSDIRLGYMRVLKQDEDGVGLLVPVWDFFGEVVGNTPDLAGKILSDPEMSLFTINAIDGSVIDRGLGY